MQVGILGQHLPRNAKILFEGEANIQAWDIKNYYSFKV